MKFMGAFGFTLIHVSLKSSPSTSSVDQKMCNNCMKETPPRDHPRHMLIQKFTAVPYIGSAYRSWQYDRRKKCEQHYWVHQQGSLSLHHHQSLLYIQEEGIFTHLISKYQYVLMTQQVTLLTLLIYLWMNSHTSVLTKLVHHTRKVSIWPDGQAWHDTPYSSTFCRDTCRQTLNTSNIAYCDFFTTDRRIDGLVM